ncbi:MAG: hypothetical protein HC833_17695 [Leptolyngbyaceae cyanobacterium RM1_406_9]|nr:hypothetical protein [Leptolyngbyaceae cyanobacterium RM1_406_9]
MAQSAELFEGSDRLPKLALQRPKLSCQSMKVSIVSVECDRPIVPIHSRSIVVCLKRSNCLSVPPNRLIV